MLRLFPEISQPLADGLGNSVTLEAAVQDLIELAGNVEIQLHGIAAIEVGVLALDVQERDSVAAGLAIQGQGELVVLKVAEGLQSHVHAFAAAEEGGRRLRRDIAKHSGPVGRERRLVNGDTVPGDADGNSARKGSGPAQSFDLGQLQELPE